MAAVNVYLTQANESVGMSQAALDALVKKWRNEGRVVDTLIHEAQTASFGIGRLNLRVIVTPEPEWPPAKTVLSL